MRNTLGYLYQIIDNFFQGHVNKNNKMLCFMVHAGYEGSDPCKKNYINIYLYLYLYLYIYIYINLKTKQTLF